MLKSDDVAENVPEYCVPAAAAGDCGEDSIVIINTVNIFPVVIAAVSGVSRQRRRPLPSVITIRRMLEIQVTGEVSRDTPAKPMRVAYLSLNN